MELLLKEQHLHNCIPLKFFEFASMSSGNVNLKSPRVSCQISSLDL